MALQSTWNTGKNFETSLTMQVLQWNNGIKQLTCKATPSNLSKTLFAMFISLRIIFLSLNRLPGMSGSIWPPSCGFSKNVSYRERVKLCFFVTFNIIISHIFPENFIEILKAFQKVQKIWRFSPSLLTIFINVLNFLTFPCYKKTNDVNI